MATRSRSRLPFSLAARSAIASAVEVLALARALQGVGGAPLSPGSLAMIQASFDEQDRGKAIGAWSGLSGVASAIGPFLGGYLVAGPGWRWVFLINVPISLVVIAHALWRVPESHDAQAPRHFDVAGAVLGALGLGGTTYAGISGHDCERAQVFDVGFRMSMIVCAVLLTTGGLLAAVIIRHPAPRRAVRRRFCAVDAPGIRASPVSHLAGVRYLA